MKNKKIIILAFLIVLLVSPAFSQSTRIYGKVENADAYTIQLKTYSDFLSRAEELVDSFEIGDDRSFELETELSSTKLHFLVIGFQKAYIYLEPNKAYQLKIKYDKEREQITFVNKAQLNFEFIDLPSDDLNHQIAAFNLKANEFLVSNFDQIYKRRNKKIIQDFSQSIKESFQNPSGFLKYYIDFRLASIEYSSGLKNRNTIFETYFGSDKILYSNDEFFQFFKEFFDKYLMKSNSHFEIQNLNKEIFGKADFGLILSTLNKDPILKNNAELKELVFLKGLYDLYFNPSSNKTSILWLINKIGQQSMFPEIEEIATSLKHQLTYLQVGTEFPKDFLEDSDDQTDKATFVSFFTIPCQDCTREMDSIATMYKKYSDDVQFISIALNTSEEALKNLQASKDYPWKIRHAELSFELAEIYQIRSLPAYFLINKEAKIVLNPALQPWRSFSLAFRSVFNY